MRKYLYIPMEIKCREYPAKGVLALKAARKGFEVFLGESPSVQSLAFNGPRGVYLGTAVLEGHRGIYEKLRASGHNLASLDEEGLVYYNKHNFLKGRVNDDVINLLDAFFLWGQHHHELCLSKGSFGNLHLVGNPRMEILKPQYLEFYRKASEDIYSRFGDFILINTNFGSVNHYLGKERNIAIVKTLIKFTPEDEAYQLAKISHAEALMGHFMRFIERFAEKHPEINIVVRPHPGENINTWKQTKRNNVHVLQEGSVISWIIPAKCLIQQNCTTAIEAMGLGVPTVSFNPEYDSRFDDSLIQEITRICATEEELIEVVESILDTDRAESVKDDFTSKARERLGYYIENLDEMSNPFDPMLRVLDAISVTTDETYGLPHRLKMLQTINASRKEEYDGYFTQKFDRLHASELRALMLMLETIEGEDYTDLNIEEIFPGKLYLLRQ